MESYQEILNVDVDNIIEKGKLSAKRKKQQKQKKQKIAVFLLCMLIAVCFGFCIFYIGASVTKKARTTQAVEKAINGFQVDPKGSTELISHAVQLYDSLTEEQQALIPDAPVFVVIKTINNIKLAPKESTMLISLAIQLYDDLTEEQRATIPNAPVQIVEEAINSIGTISRGSKGVIQLSLQIYDDLSEEQKALVSNYDVLKSARRDYVREYRT